MKTDYVLRRRVLLGISALFCTTLLLFGCQDTAIPVSPELDNLEFSDGADGLSKGPSCDKNPDKCDPGGDPPAATLSLGSEEVPGMLATAFEVEVGKDTNRTLKVSNNAFVHDIQMNFNHEPCFTWNSPTPEQKEALVGELSKNVQSGNITMTIDKTGLVLGDPEGTQSSGHSLMVDYEGTLGPTRISVAHTPAQPPYVKWVSHSEDPNVDVFQFVGYVIVTWQRGKKYDNRIVSCQPQEMVEATVSR